MGAPEIKVKRIERVKGALLVSFVGTVPVVLKASVQGPARAVEVEAVHVSLISGPGGGLQTAYVCTADDQALADESARVVFDAITPELFAWLLKEAGSEGEAKVREFLGLPAPAGVSKQVPTNEYAKRQWRKPRKQ